MKRLGFSTRERILSGNKFQTCGSDTEKHRRPYCSVLTLGTTFCPDPCMVSRGNIGRPSASFDVQQRKKPEHKARRDRMDLSRPYSYGRGHTCLITIRERTKTSAAHHGSPTRYRAKLIMDPEDESNNGI